VHGLRTLWQPPAKQETVEWAEDQAFGAPSRSRHNTHVLRAQTVLFNVAARKRAGE
jgi:hypothetical protein